MVVVVAAAVVIVLVVAVVTVVVEEVVLRPAPTTSSNQGNVLFNDALNTFDIWFYGVRHMVKNHSDREREVTRCRHMGYSFQLTVRVLLYASTRKQDNTCHGFCLTSRGGLAGTRNRSMGPP